MEKKLYLIGNAHIDPVWLWPWQEGFHEVIATFRSALDRLKEYAGVIFTASSAAFYQWIETSHPAMFAEIQQRVREGRWALVGGWWVEPDCNIPGGESFARHALYAQRYFQEKFGQIAHVGYAIDSFGHHGMLPQLLRQSGMDSYVFMRPGAQEKALPGALFWWQAPDGTRILAYRLSSGYCTPGGDLTEHVGRVAGDLTGDLLQGLCFYGVGNHGGGPTIAGIESLRRLQADPDYPARLQFSSAEAFFQGVQTGEVVALENLPVVCDDLQHHASGCYAAHSGVKRWNRLAENRLLVAEKWSAVATWTTGQPYPVDFDRAWQNVLFNQFHDILAGTSLESAYADAQETYGESLAIAGRALNLALQSIAWRIRIAPQDGQQPIVVFNPLTWPVRAPVEMEFDCWAEDAVLLDQANQPTPFQASDSPTTPWRQRLCFVADLPALGYRTYRMLGTAHFGAVQQSVDPPEDTPENTHKDSPSLAFEPDFILENPALRLQLDPQASGIASLFDKRSQTEVFVGLAARAVVIDDPSDTWSHNVTRFDQVLGEFQPVKMRWLERGAVRSVLSQSSVYQASSLEQDFILYQSLDWVEVRVTVNWQEQRKLLKLRFPVKVTAPQVTYEIPYGVIQRPADGEEEPMQAWLDVSGWLEREVGKLTACATEDAAFGESDGGLSREVGKLTACATGDVAGGRLRYGLSLLNDGKYSASVQGNEIGLTVLRSPIYAHHYPAIPEPDGPYHYQDQGIQHFRYILLPHSGSWQSAGTIRRAAALNQPAVALLATAHPQGDLPAVDSFISIEPESILVSVLKQAEDSNDLILRAVEISGQPAQATIRLPHWSRSLTADFRPWQIKTFRLPRDASLPVKETNFLE